MLTILLLVLLILLLGSGGYVRGWTGPEFAFAPVDSLFALVLVVLIVVLVLRLLGLPR